MYNVTSIDELIKMSQGEVVELPPFIQGQKFIARMKRPSMMALIKQGKIPNSLLRTANALFTGKVEDEAEVDDEFLKDLLGVIDILAEASLIEPSWQDIKSAGVELTDEQYMFIFNYTQKGLNDLQPFPEDEKSSAGNWDGSTI